MATVAVHVQLSKEASQARDYWVAKNATLRASRPHSSLRKELLLGMTIKLHSYHRSESVDKHQPWAHCDRTNQSVGFDPGRPYPIFR